MSVASRDISSYYLLEVCGSVSLRELEVALREVLTFLELHFWNP